MDHINAFTDPTLLFFTGTEQDAVKTFERILRTYPDCYTDQKRFEGLLRDYFMNDALFVNLLSAANTMRIAEAIQEAPSITNLFLYRQAKKLEEQGYSKENAELAVRIWCVCHGNLILGKVLELAPVEITMPSDDTIRLSDICGQKNNIRIIKSMIDAANLRNEPLGSILICGPENTGKMTFACAIANETKEQKRIESAHSITQCGDIPALLTNLSVGDVLIMRDIQELPSECIDALCSGIESHSIPVTIGKGISARSIILDLCPFTLIATTPEKSDIPNSLLNCFDWVCEMEPYSTEDFCDYIQQTASYFHISITPDAIRCIAEHRNQKFIRVKKVLMRLRDFVQIENVSEVTLPYVKNKLSFILT